MSQVAKLKKQAAEFEAKKQFDKAVGVYIKLLEGFDANPAELDIGLFNRVGDLLIRQGNVADAVDWYERGIDKYSDTGFFNNAIALCNKMLRHSPGRASIYYKLGRISAKKGFTNEARTNFLEYADRMQKSGKVDEAFRALGEFADLCPDQDEIRLTLAEQLVRAGRKADAIEQLQVLHERLDGEGRAHDAHAVVDRMRAIDPAVEPRKSQSRGKHKSSELIYIDVDEPTFSASMPSGIPLVPPPADPPRLVEIRRDDNAPLPVITSPVIGAPPVAGADGPPLSLSSAIDPDIYTVEDASTIFAGPVEGFTSTQMDAPAPGPLDGWGTARVITPDQLPGADPEEHEEEVPADVRDASPEIVEEVADEYPESVEDAADEYPESVEDAGDEAPEFVEEAPEEVRGAEEARDEIVDDERDDDDSSEYTDDVDPEEQLRAAIELENATSPATPVAVAAVEEAPEAEPLDGSMEELLGDLAMPGPTTVTDTSMPDADSPNAVQDAPVVEPAADRDAPEAEPPRSAPPEPIPGILLADALGASSRPDDSGEQRVPLDEGIDEPLAFATPSQSRRSTAVAAKSVEALRAAVEAAPEDWLLRRDLGEAMLDAGDRAGGIQELERAMSSAEQAGKLDLASSIAEEVARIEPEVAKHQQKRVEYAFRTNDRGRLVEAYLGLANVLLRSDQVEKARTIYQRVLDLAPDEPRARLAISSITPSSGRLATSGFTPLASPAVRRSDAIPMPRRSGGAPVRPASGSYINLGDELRVDDVPRDTRMVVPEAEPTGDEQADFADMLRKFKAGIARNVAPEDHQSHYDLAIAYKEMGLVDEAIAEFQKALASPTNRLPTYEALGQCFLEKEQFKLASSVLSRALSERASEDQLVGILYLLGRAAELQGKADEALAYYQRVFVVDIQFRDIVDRMSEVEQTLR